MSSPSDVCIVAAAQACHRSHGGVEKPWFCAEEVKWALQRLGFEVSLAKVAGMLRRASLMDSPPIESQDAGPFKEYRVTGFGRLWMRNLLPGLRDA